jgi:hypothetical protein
MNELSASITSPRHSKGNRNAEHSTGGDSEEPARFLEAGQAVTQAFGRRLAESARQGGLGNLSENVQFAQTPSLGAALDRFHEVVEEERVRPRAFLAFQADGHDRLRLAHEAAEAVSSSGG